MIAASPAPLRAAIRGRATRGRSRGGQGKQLGGLRPGPLGASGQLDLNLVGESQIRFVTVELLD
jgi:hypothetical protein